MTETPATPAAPTAKATAQRLQRIEIRNYKALDALDLDLPPPLMAGDPDVFVVGSSNGIGKTSLLECCALAHRSVLEMRSNDPWSVVRHVGSSFQNAIRAGQSLLVISAVHEPGTRLELRLTHGRPTFEAGPSQPPTQLPPQPLVENFRVGILGQTPNPLLDLGLLYFHSARKIVEGPARLTAAPLQAEDSPNQSHPSILKRVILRALMTKAGLFENVDNAEALSVLDPLNHILRTFTGGIIDKLRMLGNDQVDIRIATPTGASFTFDGLSSGQKEIVSTLFLIWNVTRTRPALVLIDEPELHLNAEWQRIFVRELHRLAPHNQYILATHSEEVFASVEADRRILLTVPRV